ncbi:hypothetical protein Zm00014a_021189 [Zea mays]|uniref:Uncharacterized protein n=1 Tax=Zea mays TaxID=4577 RepID=A0A3L6G4A6_MAIZE|nr:hypothetical protein Zm00014a_021189 [Zea mays]
MAGKMQGGARLEREHGEGAGWEEDEQGGRWRTGKGAMAARGACSKGARPASKQGGAPR